MKLRLRQLLISLILLPLVLTLVVFSSPQKASAVTGADWKPGRIIDDSVFFNKDSMSVVQIQTFLNSKVPVCAKNHSAYSATYPGPYTCLKDYQENTATGESNVGRYNGDGSPYQVPGGKSAAQIIWDAAQAYTINPQTLVVMLQKEQSLVTDDWPLITQYQKAMGQSCPDTAPCDPAFAGFYRQVSGAAWQLRHYINNPTWFNYRSGVTRFVLYNPSSSCGGTNVFIENNATAALYNYTPYQPNAGALSNLYGTAPCGAYGNRNFWRLFNTWFGDTLRVLVSANGGTYLIENGTKRPFPNEETFYSYSYKWSDVRPISAAELSLIPEGAAIEFNAHRRDGLLVTSRPGGVYVVENGFKRPFPNEATFFSFSYTYTDALVISATELSLIPEGAAMAYNVNFRNGKLISVVNQGIYLVENGFKRPFPNEATFLSYSYRWIDVLNISATEITLIPYGTTMPMSN